MLLTCPHCATRYMISHDALGVEGRRVRCSQCKHSWFQPASDEAVAAAAGTDAHGADEQAPPAFPVGEANARPADPVPPTPPADVADEAAPTNEETLPAPPSALPDTVDPFAHAPPFRPRRNLTRLKTIAAVTIGLMLLAINVALWMAGGVDGLRAMLTGRQTTTTAMPLLLERRGEVSRRRIEGGHEMLEIAGRIRNPTTTTQNVPDIRATLIDQDGRTVHRWTITPPVRQLAAGANADFTGMTIDAPASARGARLSFPGATGG